MAIICIIIFTSLVLTNAALSFSLISEENINSKLLANEFDDSFDFAMISQSPGSLTKFIDKIVEVLIKFISKMFTIIIGRMEPLKLTLNQAITFENKYYKLACSLHNVTVNSLSKLTITKIVSKVVKRKVEFAFNFPVLNTTETSYDLSGRAQGMTIKATGEMRTNVTKLEVSGSLRYRIAKKIIQIQNLQIHYDFQKLSAAVTNLNIPLVTKEKINEMVSSLMSKYLKKEEEVISKYISIKIKEKVNELLQNVIKMNTSETSLY